MRLYARQEEGDYSRRRIRGDDYYGDIERRIRRKLQGRGK